MRNPLRSEADAFRLVIVVVVALGLIALGAWINTWVGVGVAVAEALLAGWVLLFRSPPPEAPVVEAPAASPPGEHRVLVVANEAVGAPELLQRLREHAAGNRLRVLVVVPVPAPASAQWTGDEGDARGVAERRLADCLASMRSAGIEAQGEIGEIDPMQAVEDAVRTFAPDELIVSTHPDGRMSAFEEGLPERLAERFAMPMTHVVVELDADLHDS